MSSQFNFIQLRKHFLEASCPSITQEAKDEEYANNILEVFSNRLPQISPEDSETIFLIEKALVVLPSSKLDTPEAKALLAFLESTGQFKNKEVINKLLRSSVLSGNLFLTQKMLALGADPNTLVGLDKNEEVTTDDDESWFDEPGSQTAKQSLLSIALSGNNEDIVLELLKHHIKVKDTSHALPTACRKNFTKAALVLMNEVENINERDNLDNFFSSSLHHACHLKNEQLIFALIKKGASLLTHNLNKQTSLDFISDDVALLEKVTPLLSEQEREFVEFLILVQKNQPDQAIKKLNGWNDDLLKQAKEIFCLQLNIIKHGNDKFPKTSITALFNQLSPNDKNKLFAQIPTNKRKELIDHLTDQGKQEILNKQIIVVNSYSGQTDNYGDARAALETINTDVLPFTESEHGARYIGQITHILDQIGFIGIHLLYQEQRYRAILDRCISYISGDQLSVITSLLSPDDWHRIYSNTSLISSKSQLIQNSSPEQLNTLSKLELEVLELAALIKNESKQPIQEKIDSWLDAENRNELFEKASSFRELKIWILKYGSNRVYQYLNLPILDDNHKNELFRYERGLQDQELLDRKLLDAINKNDYSLIKILSYLGADSNHGFDSGETVLHRAVTNFNPGAISIFLRTGGYLHAVNNQRKTPLDLLRANYPQLPPDIKPDTLAEILELLHFVRSHDAKNYLSKINSWLTKDNSDELFQLANSLEELKPYTFIYDDIKNLYQVNEENPITEVLELLNLVGSDGKVEIEEKINSWITKPTKQALFKFASIIPELKETIILYQIQNSDQFPEMSLLDRFRLLSLTQKHKFFPLVSANMQKEMISSLTPQEKQDILSRQIIVVNSLSRQTDNYGDARAALETINTRALPFTESERGAYYIDQITHILDQIGFIGIHLLYQEQEYRAILDRCTPYISGDQLSVISSLLSPDAWYRTYSNTSLINRKKQLIQASNPEQFNRLQKADLIDAGYSKAEIELREIKNTLDSHITKKDFSELVAKFKKQINPDMTAEDFSKLKSQLKTAIIPYAAKEGLEKLIESRLKPDMSDEEYMQLTDEIFSHLNELSEKVYQKLESDFYKLSLNQYKINQDQIWEGVNVALQKEEFKLQPNPEINNKFSEAKEAIQSIHNQHKNLAARLEKIDEQFETEIPEEFLDALHNDKIMKDPVKIPGGYIVDRSTLIYGIDDYGQNINFPRNPFINNQHFEPNQIEPLPDLKKRIDEWTKDQKKSS